MLVNGFWYFWKINNFRQDSHKRRFKFVKFEPVSGTVCLYRVSHKEILYYLLVYTPIISKHYTLSWWWRFYKLFLKNSASYAFTEARWWNNWKQYFNNISIQIFLLKKANELMKFEHQIRAYPKNTRLKFILTKIHL